ncbi:MAG TPA: hypothetical protein VNA18_01555 [Nitrososphaeraceae archaeon]|nr:hypothetical protein [Nitrososphaeraceae archaeon]
MSSPSVGSKHHWPSAFTTLGVTSAIVPIRTTEANTRAIIGFIKRRYYKKILKAYLNRILSY